MILGKLVERQSGRRLDEFAREQIFDVLGMTGAHFRPLELKPREPAAR